MERRHNIVNFYTKNRSCIGNLPFYPAIMFFFFSKIRVGTQFRLLLIGKSNLYTQLFLWLVGRLGPFNLIDLPFGKL